MAVVLIVIVVVSVLVVAVCVDITVVLAVTSDAVAARRCHANPTVLRGVEHSGHCQLHLMRASC